jgi:hypothetical protein
MRAAPEKRKPTSAKVGSHENGKADSSSEHKDKPSRPTRQAKWQAANPVARWAHLATASAIRRGILVRQPCCMCGDPKSDAHHPDHRDPLRVEWYCRTHHVAEHRRLKAEGGGG